MNSLDHRPCADTARGQGGRARCTAGTL